MFDSKAERFVWWLLPFVVLTELIFTAILTAFTFRILLGGDPDNFATSSVGFIFALLDDYHLIILLIGAVWLRFGVVCIYNYRVADSIRLTTILLTQNILSHYARLASEAKPSEVIQICNVEVGNYSAGIRANRMLLVGETLAIAAVFSSLLIFEPTLLVYLICFLGAAWVLYRFVLSGFFKALGRSRAHADLLRAESVDLLTRANDELARFGTFPKFVSLAMGRTDQVLLLNRTLSFTKAQIRPIAELVVLTSVAVFVLASPGSISVGLAGLGVVVVRGLPMVTKLLSLKASISSFGGSERAILKFLQASAPLSYWSCDSESSPISCSVRDVNVSFLEESFSKSLKFSRRFTRVVGPSGAGKSTFLNIIAGTQAVSSGGVMWSGISGRGDLGYVSQDPVIFNGTVLENILIGRPLSDAAEQIVGDMTRLRIWDLFSADGGLSACLGREGIKLSGGQKLRLNLCRAVLQRPKVLLLDEVFAALDSESKAIVEDFLIESDYKIVYVSHVPSRLDDLAESYNV